jgi:hypothetical protein
MIDSRSPSEEGFCLKCRYPLRGLPEPRCPECGTVFHPNDRHTFLVAGQRPIGPTARWLYRPPGRVFRFICVFVALLAFLSGISPGCILPFALLSAFLFPILMGIWTLRLVISLSVAFWYKPPMGGMKSALAWVWPPGVFLLAIILYILNVPLYFGFVVNKPFLDRLSARVAANPTSVLTDRMVGLYPVDQIIEVGKGVRIRVRGGDGGLGYFPQAPPTGSNEIEYVRFWGDWYGWRRAGFEGLNPFVPPLLERARDG